MTTSSENLEVRLQRTGGADNWLMPMALIGCLMVLGPAMAMVFDFLPNEWIHDSKLVSAAALVGVSGVALGITYVVARKVLKMRHRLFRIEDGSFAVYDRKGNHRFIETPREEVEVECRNWTIESPAGDHVSPVLGLRAPGTEWLTISVDDSSIRWDEEAGECPEDAEYTVSKEDWRRLLEALGVRDRIVRKS